ncbi:cupin domain-containing protein [Holophaga foetida]|uniref:cupin domain-containing protein n=1 Tax=Holophaga foetida TaxID=35839 RepID=UPI0002471804|nr:cupin domain-containing protein [Holophaga foetida]
MTANKNYQATLVAEMYKPGRTVLHDDLALTSAEVSINTLPAGVSLPFIHAHKQNEEIYVVLKGKGLFYIDGEEFGVQEGCVVRIDPAAARSIKADEASELTYVCVQAKAGSLEQHTQGDGLPAEGQPSWQK